MNYKLIDNLDLDHWSRTFQEDKRCRITSVMPEVAAASMAECIRTHAEFKQAHILGNQYKEISRADFSRLSQEQRSQIVREVYLQAQKGVGFWYGRNGLNAQTSEPLAEIYQWLRSAEVLNMVRTVTGNVDLIAPSAQITSFAPGDFLTRHRDEVTRENRRIAFVLNLTRDWHPDWGGLLQFFHDDGRTREAWPPQFNSLCLFDVKHVHSVTCIAPFTPKNRISISGWFHE